MSKIIFPLLFVILLFGVFLLWQLVLFSDRNLHIVFCDVGQGDGILITTPLKKQFLIDGGPDDRILSCLSKYMPFWDREIELVMVSHPQIDHFGGMEDIVSRYTIGTFVEPGVDGEAQAWKELKKELQAKQVRMKTVKKGDRILVDGLSFFVLNPYDAKFQSADDVNNASIVGVVSYGKFDVLLTGDILPKAISSFVAELPDIEVLKVPHHGSRNGLTKEMLLESLPEVAVITSGKKNKFGHPHTEVLSMLKKVKTLRTDTTGDIEVISDGKTFWVKE